MFFTSRAPSLYRGCRAHICAFVDEAWNACVPDSYSKHSTNKLTNNKVVIWQRGVFGLLVEGCISLGRRVPRLAAPWAGARAPAPHEPPLRHDLPTAFAARAQIPSVLEPSLQSLGKRRIQLETLRCKMLHGSGIRERHVAPLAFRLVRLGRRVRSCLRYLHEVDEAQNSQALRSQPQPALRKSVMAPP